MTTAGGQQPKSVNYHCSGNLSKRTSTNKDTFAKARKEFNHAEKIAKRRYKLKRELADSSLSSKKWWNTVNTLSGKSTRADIPVLKDQHQTYTSAKEKVEKFCLTFATKCQLDNAEDPAPEVQRSTAHSTERIAFRAKDI